MVRARSRATTPEQQLRDLRKEIRQLERDEPGPERAARLAEVTAVAHRARQLNLAMHTATLCLEDDPAAPDLLVAAYEQPDDAEERLSALSDLRQLAGYVDRPDLAAQAERLLVTTARGWVGDADEGERRYRLRTVQSLVSREIADELRDELAPPR